MTLHHKIVAFFPVRQQYISGSQGRLPALILALSGLQGTMDVVVGQALSRDILERTGRRQRYDIMQNIMREVPVVSPNESQ